MNEPSVKSLQKKIEQLTQERDIYRSYVVGPSGQLGDDDIKRIHAAMDAGQVDLKDVAKLLIEVNSLRREVENLYEEAAGEDI